MKYAELQIATIHGKPIDWVGISTFLGGDALARAERYAYALISGLTVPPHLRIVDADGNIVQVIE